MKRISALLAVGAVAICFASSANAQRAVGARSLVLDDGQTPPHTLTISTPSSPSAAWTAWQTAGFPAYNWIVPIPPANNASAGFVYSGPASGGVIPHIAYWVPPSTAGFNNNGGTSGAWDYATAAQLGLAGSISGTANTIAKFNGGGNNVTNSLLTDNGTTLIYGGAGGFNVGGTTNMLAATVAAGLNITAGTLLMGGTSVLDQGRNLFNIGNISLAGSIGTATSVTASGAITGGSLTTAGAVTAGSAGITGAAVAGLLSTAGGLSLTGAASALSLNGSAGAAGAILTSAGAGATPTWTTLLSPASGGTGVNNGANTITLGGNFATSGANAVTLFSTGLTNVVLPTVGTLAVTSNPGIAVAWGVVSFNSGAGTAALVSSYNCSGITVGGGPFFSITGVNTGGHANLSIMVSWYGGVGSDIGNASGLLAGWWSGGSSFSFADYTIGGGGAEVWPKNFVSFVIYGN